MPLRLVLERKFSEIGLKFPRFPLETASTVTTLMLLQQDPSIVALMPEEVAEAATEMGVYVGYVGVPHGVELNGEELFFEHAHLHGGPAPVRQFLSELINAQRKTGSGDQMFDPICTNKTPKALFSSLYQHLNRARPVE